MASKKCIQDYTMVCRTCLQSNVEMLNLSALINDNLQQEDCKISYMDCLRSCIQVEEIEEEMPGRICLECASALQVAYWFMKNASQAQELLKIKLREIRNRQKQREIKASYEEMQKTKRYRCKICNVKVETKRCLKDHIKLHLDIIVYTCQLCTFESHKRSNLAEHYFESHGLDATREQLKPKTKTSNSTTTTAPSTQPEFNIKTEESMMGAIKNEHFQVLSEAYPTSTATTTQYTFLDSFQKDFLGNPTIKNNNNFDKLSQEETNVLTTNENNQQNITEIQSFSSVDGDLSAVTNDINIGNEFIVMADGSVEEVMGKGVVIEYINADNDTGLTLENGNLVLENIIQVDNIDNTNMLVAQNDIIQMDVDDLIIEDPVNTPEETQNLPPIVEEVMQPEKIVKPAKKIVCKICTKDFITQEQLKNHMLTHNEIPHFFCDQCKFYTFFKIDLHQHYKSKHNLHPTSKQLQPKNKQKTKQVYSCGLCLYQSDLKMDLKRHYLGKHKIDATETHLKATTVESPNLRASTYMSKAKAAAAASRSKNVEIKPIEQLTPDYPNGLNCRKCHEVFHWRNKLYEHYKLHNAEEAALKQEKQFVKVQNTAQSQMQQTKPQHQILQTQIQQQQPIITQTSLELTNTTTFSNIDALSLTLTSASSAPTLNAMAPLTPSSSSTYTLPSDAIPQIVETDQTIENDLNFDFNGDALFEDFDDDVDVENDSDDNDSEFRNVLLTSDDDFEEMLQEQNNPHNADAPTESYCSHCQKNFMSQYQFENHMFVHRGLAPYRCEMCTNLYNTKRCLIRHYKAVHKKVPTREMIQAKGDKVFDDSTPIENLKVEESKAVTLMCAKCPYESLDFNDLQSHLNLSHSLSEETYILRKLPFECPRCIRSFATKTKILRHLERNHSSTPINKHQIQFDLLKTTANSSSTTSSANPLINNHLNMMQTETSGDPNASCASGYYDMFIKSEQQQQQFTDPATTFRRSRHELSIEDAVAPNVVMSNFQNSIEDNTTNTNSSASLAFNETSSSKSNHNKNPPALSTTSLSRKKNLNQKEDPESNEDDEEEDDDDDDDEQDLADNIEMYEEELALFTCKICHLTCYTLESFDVHSKNVECRRLTKSSPEGKFVCEICQCHYKSMYLLKHHLKRHIGRKFRCLQCPKTFINRMELEGHQLVHSGERPHKCDLCPKSFSYLHHLKRHKDIVHFGKRHLCTEPNCSSKFTTLSQLKGHMWSHNGIVPYRCEFCDRIFKKRLLLRKHCAKLHKVILSEEEIAEIFRKSVGYTNPHDFTVAIKNGKMLRRADLETMGASGVIKSSFK